MNLIQAIEILKNHNEWRRGTEIRVNEIEYSEKNKQIILIRATYQLGKDYDFKSTCIDWIIYLAFGKWTGYTGNNTTDKFYCSEYVSYCLSYAKFYITSPAMLYKESKYKTVYEGLDNNFKYYI